MNKSTRFMHPKNINYLLYNELLINIKRLNSEDFGQVNKKKVTKKGLILTISIIAAVVAASFLVYFIP